MNVQYDSALTGSPPITPQMQAAAARAMQAGPAHSQYGSQYRDVMRSAGGQAASQYARAADQVNYASDVALTQQQQQLAQMGLQGLLDQQQQRQGLQQARLGTMRGILGALM
jgi:hypothetical protein